MDKELKLCPCPRYVALLVDERRNMVQHQQLVSGMVESLGYLFKVARLSLLRKPHLKVIGGHRMPWEWHEDKSDDGVSIAGTISRSALT